MKVLALRSSFNLPTSWSLHFSLCRSTSLHLGRKQHSIATPHDDPDRKRIAVLGGGITGLAAAFFASQKYPDASITLFEGSNRLGGVIESKLVDAGEGRKMVCETGPRTLRATAPRAIVTMDLIHSLALPSSLLLNPRTSSTSSTRYIFHPPRPVSIPTFSLLPHALASLPAPSSLPLPSLLRLAHTLLTHPLFAGLAPALLRDAFFAPPRPAAAARARDDSVMAFATRQFGANVARSVVAAAVAHGLHAGDAERLSARALLPGLWEAESRAEERRAGGGGHGGVVEEVLKAGLCCAGGRDGEGRGMWAEDNDGSCSGAAGPPSLDGETTRHQRAVASEAKDREAGLLRRLRDGPAGELERTVFRDVGLFSFKRGIGELTGALAKTLQGNENVLVELNTQAEAISPAADGSVSLTTRRASSPHHDHHTFTHVIATTPLNTLLSTVRSSPLSSNTTPSPNPPPLPPAIHQETSTVTIVTLIYARPSANAPYTGFGYLLPPSLPHSWNPERALGVVFDSDTLPAGQDGGPRATKISVVLGGHYWNHLSSYPTSEACIAAAKALLARQIGLQDEPVQAVATLQRDALPQYTVGHFGRMGAAHAWLARVFAGRVRVAGKSYGGIAVHDCLFGARAVVEGLEREGPEMTGLERFADEVVG